MIAGESDEFSFQLRSKQTKTTKTRKFSHVRRSYFGISTFSFWKAAATCCMRWDSRLSSMPGLILSLSLHFSFDFSSCFFVIIFSFHRPTEWFPHVDETFFSLLSLATIFSECFIAFCLLEMFRVCFGIKKNGFDNGGRLSDALKPGGSKHQELCNKIIKF